MQCGSNSQKKFEFVDGATIIGFKPQTPDLEKSFQIEENREGNLNITFVD